MPSQTKDKTTKTPPNPNFKHTELGWIPKDWEVKKLDEAVFIDKHKVDFNKFNDKKIPYVSLSDITDKIVYPKEIDFNTAPSRARKIAKKHDILLATVRPNLKNFTKINSYDFLIVSTGFNVLTEKNELINFIYHLIFSQHFDRQFYKLLVGSNYPAINTNDVKKLKVPLPPLPEQQAIADCLSTWDEAIEKQGQLIKAKQEQHKGLRQLLLTGKKRLTNPETGNVFDREWVKKRLGEISTSFSGGTPSSKVKEYWNGNIHWIKSGELNQSLINKTSGFITELGIKNSSAKIVNQNTLLVAMYGATAGVCAITKIKGAINQAVLAIIPNERTNNLFLFYKLKIIMPSMVHRLTQGGQPNLSGGIIKNIKIKLPSLQEQTAIAEVLETSSKEIELLEEQLHQLQLQKKGLMQQLLSGEKRLVG